MATTDAIPFREYLARVLPRARIKRDPEGFDYTPARYGRLEDRGCEPDGERRLWVFTDRPVMIRRLQAIPGVTLTQVGDGEAAGWLRADDESAIRAVAVLLKVRTRRAPMTAEQARILGAGTAYRASTQPKDAS